MTYRDIIEASKQYIQIEYRGVNEHNTIFSIDNAEFGFRAGTEWANKQFMKFLEDEMNSLNKGQLPHYTIERLIKRWKNQKCRTPCKILLL